MNYYNHMAAANIIPIDGHDVSGLLKAADAAGIKPAVGPKGTIFLYSDNGAFDLSELQQATDFLRLLSEHMRKIGLDFLEFGVSCSADRCNPGSEGGFKFRIYNSGTVTEPKEVWPDVPSENPGMEGELASGVYRHRSARHDCRCLQVQKQMTSKDIRAFFPKLEFRSFRSCGGGFAVEFVRQRAANAFPRDWICLYDDGSGDVFCDAVFRELFYPVK